MTYFCITVSTSSLHFLLVCIQHTMIDFIRTFLHKYVMYLENICPFHYLIPSRHPCSFPSSHFYFCVIDMTSVCDFGYLRLRYKGTKMTYFFNLFYSICMVVSSYIHFLANSIISFTKKFPGSCGKIMFGLVKNCKTLFKEILTDFIFHEGEGAALLFPYCIL